MLRQYAAAPSIRSAHAWPVALRRDRGPARAGVGRGGRRRAVARAGPDGRRGGAARRRAARRRVADPVAAAEAAAGGVDGHRPRRGSSFTWESRSPGVTVTATHAVDPDPGGSRLTL